jgi:hypothetical protein
MLAGMIAGALGSAPSDAATRQIEVHHWVRRQGGLERELLTRIPTTVRDGSARMRLRRERAGQAPEFVEVRFDRLDSPAATVQLTLPRSTAPLAFEAGQSVVRLESSDGGWSVRSSTLDGDDPAESPAPGTWELEVEPGRRAPQPAGVTVALADVPPANPVR